MKLFKFIPGIRKKTLKTVSEPDKREILNSIIMDSLKESEREKELILNSIDEKVCYLDTDYRIRWVNEAGLKKVSSDKSVADIIGKPCYAVLHKRVSVCPNCPAVSTLKTGWPFRGEVSHEDGTTSLVSTQPVTDDNGKIQGVIEVELDISVRKEAEKALDRSRLRSEAILNAIPDMLIVFNEAGIFIDYHPAADFSLVPSDVEPDGKRLEEVLPADLAASIMKTSASLSDSGGIRSFEYKSENSENIRYYECRLAKTGGNENVCIISDISQRKSRENAIYFRSFHDSLTGLYNSAYFREELKKLEHSRRALPSCILIIDVNSLKLTNDAFGHQTGDLLLKRVAGILSSNCRKSDVISRTGGDEFSIILPGSPLAKAEKLAERIIKACGNSRYDDIFTRPSVSAGCAVRNDSSLSFEDTIREADERMYQMKLANREKQLNILVNDILTAVDSRCAETRGHADRCVRLAGMFSVYSGMAASSSDKLKALARLHDIGKIRINRDILYSENRLSEEDFAELKQHPVIGYRIAKAVPDFASTAELILSHHERWDGRGYPSGLSGLAIPFPSRVFAVIDTIDWFLNINTGEKNSDEAVSGLCLRLQQEAGSRLDPDITEIFIQLVNKNREIFINEIRL